MKAISVLGTSSNAGKSWVATALCAWLRRQGVAVAPFKAQNMANNAYATLEGGEIGAAQAVQAEACGLRPIAEMNPILLKPSGPSSAQIVRLGRAGEETDARRYYASVESSWSLVAQTLDWWRGRCDALVLEGAGSPVELNLMDRDIVNLRPSAYVDGKWILVADIEEGGVFAQVLGTWQLLPEAMRARGLGFIVNKFRGDLALFDDAREHFAKHLPLPYLGVLPFCEGLRIDDEDSFNARIAKRPVDGEPFVAWIKYPQVSNTQDQLPFGLDEGWHCEWTTSADGLAGAAAIVLPGSKNTLADLRWLRAQGLDMAILDTARTRAVPIVGICGGYQMLGERVEDRSFGVSEPGLGLLPVVTELANQKRVTRRRSRADGFSWETYEIHTGVTRWLPDAAPQPLLEAQLPDGNWEPEGVRLGQVWGSYLHGLFDAAPLRESLTRACGLMDRVRVSPIEWTAHRQETYAAMADAMETHLDLSPIREYFGLDTRPGGGA